MIHKTVGEITHSYEGHPSGYDFKRMRKCYEQLKQMLGEWNVELTHMVATTHVGEQGYGGSGQFANMTKFRVTAGDPQNPVFVWYKYEGYVTGGGRNMVQVAGREMYFSDFVAMCDLKRLMMLHGMLEGVLAMPQKKRGRK